MRQQLGARGENVQCRLVHGLIEFRPENLVGARFHPDLLALHQFAGGAVSCQRISLGTHPGFQYGFPNRRVAVGLGPIGLIQIDQLLRGLLEARR